MWRRSRPGSRCRVSEDREALKKRKLFKDDFIAELWSSVERLITEGKVGGAGLSDLNPRTFFNIYEAAEIKPTSVQVNSILRPFKSLNLGIMLRGQVNLKSCCVVPEELSLFVKEKGVTLLTHSDPSEILPEDSLR